MVDLHWLIHQGAVLEFADGHMETAKKPAPKPPPWDLRQPGREARRKPPPPSGDRAHRGPHRGPPLGQDCSQGGVGAADRGLTARPDIDELDAEWDLGVPAERLDPAGGRVVLASGEHISADGVVIDCTTPNQTWAHAFALEMDGNAASALRLQKAFYDAVTSCRQPARVSF